MQKLQTREHLIECKVHMKFKFSSGSREIELLLHCFNFVYLLVCLSNTLTYIYRST